MVQQLRLSPSELAIYSNPEFLPTNKRSAEPRTPESTLKLRIADEKCPLPTLCASYSSQHQLNQDHIRHRGIFAVLVKDGKFVSFVDLPRWISLLGATEKIVLPSKVPVAFRIVGNAIAVPHALLALLFAFQSIHNMPLAITDTIRQCWKNRLVQPTSVILAGTDFWTLVSMQEYMNGIQALPLQMDFQGTLVNLTITFRRHSQIAQMRIPAQWSLKRLILQVLDIDHHASRMVNSGNINRRVGSHTTLQHMAALEQEWDLYLKSIEFAKITFQGLSIPEHCQHVHGQPKRSLDDRQLIRLEIPTFEQTLDTPTFQRFLSIMESFYAATRIVTPDDAKQTVSLGIPPPGFVTSIPIRKGSQLEQIKQITTQLFPNEPIRAPHIAPVPLSTTRQYPLYLLAKTTTTKDTVTIFIEEHMTPSNIYTAELPPIIHADDQLQFHGKTHDILYHNAAFLSNAQQIHLHQADIITTTLAQASKKHKQNLPIVAAGHHTHTPVPSLKAPINFLTRVEFAINTKGWMASDELDFACQHLECAQPGFGKYIGIGFGTRTLRTLHQ